MWKIITVVAIFCLTAQSTSSSDQVIRKFEQSNDARGKSSNTGEISMQLAKTYFDRRKQLIVWKKI